MSIILGAPLFVVSYEMIWRNMLYIFRSRRTFWRVTVTETWGTTEFVLQIEIEESGFASVNWKIKYCNIDTSGKFICVNLFLVFKVTSQGICVYYYLLFALLPFDVIFTNTSTTFWVTLGGIRKRTSFAASTRSTTVSCEFVMIRCTGITFVTCHSRLTLTFTFCVALEISWTWNEMKVLTERLWMTYVKSWIESISVPNPTQGISNLWHIKMIIVF